MNLPRFGANSEREHLQLTQEVNKEPRNTYIGLWKPTAKVIKGRVLKNPTTDHKNPQSNISVKIKIKKSIKIFGRIPQILKEPSKSSQNGLVKVCIPFLAKKTLQYGLIKTNIYLCVILKLYLKYLNVTKRLKRFLQLCTNHLIQIKLWRGPLRSEVFKVFVMRA